MVNMETWVCTQASITQSLVVIYFLLPKHKRLVYWASSWFIRLDCEFGFHLAWTEDKVLVLSFWKDFVYSHTKVLIYILY